MFDRVRVEWSKEGGGGVSNIENIAKSQHELIVQLESVETTLRNILTMKNNVIAQYNRHVSETRSAMASDSDVSSSAVSDGRIVAVESEVSSVDDGGASLHASGAFYKQFLSKEGASA